MTERDRTVTNHAKTITMPQPPQKPVVLCKHGKSPCEACGWMLR